MSKKRDDNVTTIFPIPANFTDSGKILGMISFRNCFEAILFGIVPGYFFLNLGLFPFIMNLIITIVLFGCIVVFCLIGVNDDPASIFLKNVYKFVKNKNHLRMRFKRINDKAVK